MLSVVERRECGGDSVRPAAGQEVEEWWECLLSSGERWQVGDVYLVVLQLPKVGNVALWHFKPKGGVVKNVKREEGGVRAKRERVNKRERVREKVRAFFPPIFSVLICPLNHGV